MRGLLEFATQINMEFPNKEILNEIEFDNQKYLKKKYIIDITFINPYFYNTDNKKIDKKSIFIFSKIIDIEKNILRTIQHIPKNDFIYFIRFLGYSSRISHKMIPDYNTLLEKNVFIIY
jgi:hypothetical protein